MLSSDLFSQMSPSRKATSSEDLTCQESPKQEHQESSSQLPSSINLDDNFALRVLCPKCGKTFKNKSNLKIHMLTHSGVKPFGCKAANCTQGFTTKQCLQFHYRKHHGFSKDNMPKIQRDIPYTLAAYSGGIINNASTILEKKIKRSSTDLLIESHSQDETSDSLISSHAAKTSLLGTFLMV